MCDKCPCSTFAPHLWKAGECRDCHHSISEHAIVPTATSTPTPHVTTSQHLEVPQPKHSFVGKLSVDKLEPFSHIVEEPKSPLATSSGVNNTILRSRSSITLSTPPHDHQSGTRLSVNHGPRLQAIEEREEESKPSRNSMRRSTSFKVPGEVDTQTTYEDRLAASFRKSREIYHKRKSSADVGADTMKEQHKALIIEELVVTERDYCRDMDYLIQMIVEPLLSKSLLDRTDVAGIFSNIQEIRAVNNALLQQLEQSANLSAQTVGEIFSKMSAFFKCYSKYCTNHVNSLNKLQERKKERPELAVYLKTLKFNSNAGKLGVEDYLIKPIQRICKYPLFFHQLLEYTATGSKDHLALTEANTQMQKVAAHVNDFHRQAENMNRVLDIQQRVHGTPITLVSSSRRFIFEQQATVKTLEEPSWNTRCIFLFSDLLLYARPPTKFSKKYTYVGTVDLEIASLSVSDSEVSLVKSDGTPLLQLAVSDSDNKHWVTILRTAIEDTSSKRMSLQQALKETGTVQREDSRELKRRSSYRNSMMNLNTDEILNRRGTLKRVDSALYAKLSLMNFDENHIFHV